MNRILNLFCFILAITLILSVTQVFAIDKKERQATPIQAEEVNPVSDQVSSDVVYEVPQSLSKQPLAGTYTIGALGDYPTLHSAILDLNANGISGDVTFLFTDPAYTDTGLSILAFPGVGTGTVTFKPASGVNTRIYFSGGASLGGFRYGLHFQTTANIVWDGSNSGGTDRSLTLEMDTTITPRSNVLLIRRNSRNLVFKNIIMKGYRISTGAAGLGSGNALDVVRIDNVITGTPGPQYNITIDNCQIMRGGGGIFIRGQNGSNFDYNYTITNNDIGPGYSTYFPDYLSLSAIWTENVKDITIYKNKIGGIVVAGGAPVGFNFRVGTANAQASYNHVFNLVTLSGATRPLVIIIGGSGTSVPYRLTAKFWNNMFYDVHNFGTGAGGRGMDLIFGNPTSPPYGNNTGAGSTVEFYHNTFHVAMDATEGVGNTAFIFDGNFFGAGTTVGHADSIIAYNNIFSLRREGTDFVRSHLWFAEGAPGNLQTFIDYNLYYENRGGFFAQVPNPWPTGENYMVPTMEEWTQITGNDANSKFGDPMFVSTTDAHINTAMGVVSPADAMGTALYTYDDDIDGELRAALTPVDVGADAFIAIPWNYDALPLAILSPFVGGVPSAVEVPIAVRVRNNSINSFQIPVKFEVYDATDTKIFEATDITDTAVSPYTTSVLNFDTKWLTPAPGTYKIYAYTTLGTDDNPANDTIWRLQEVKNYLVVSNVATTPYFEDFESGMKSTSTIEWEATALQGPVHWFLGNPTKFGGAYSGTNAWVFGPLGANYDSNRVSALNSPYFDFTNVQKPIISFKHIFSIEDDWDGVILQYTEDFGYTWNTIGVYQDPNGKNWYNENANTFIFYPDAGWSDKNNNYPQWDYAQIKAYGLAGKLVRLRFVFGADAYINDLGYALDDFGIAVASSIAGMKWYDLNKDGVKDLEEVGLEGWTINLTGDATDSKTTDIDGKYEFTDLFDGNYTVSEVLKPGWVNSYPQGGSYEITLLPGQSAVDKNFGNYWANASITGVKWEDLNADGVKDAGEPGLDGWTINYAGPMSGSVVTHDGGLYEIVGLTEGTYTVSEVVQSGWKKTYPATVHTVVISTEGQVVADVNFGNFKYAAISGVVYKDVNHNGVKDVGEVGLDGITVNLTGPEPASTVTTGGGLYTLPAFFGANNVKAVAPAGKYVTYPVMGYDLVVNTSGLVFTDKNFGVSTLLDSNKYRSFLPEHIAAVDAKGKVPKAVKRKPVGGYWEFELTNNTGSDQTELHIQFKNDVAFDRGLTAEPFTSVGGDTKKKFDFTGATIPDGETVLVKGYSKKGKPQQIKKYYWGADPKQHFAVNINPDFEYLELPMPSYANLIEEVYADGGFADDGGLLVGTPRPDAPKDFGWVLMGKAGDVQKSLRDKTGLHTGGPKLFTTFENGKPLVKLQKTLPPSKHNNKLFAELVALKLAIAASATEHIPLGFGELVYDDTVSALAAFNGKMIKQIYAQISAAMTAKTGDPNVYYQIVRKLNEAFAGPLDTVSFASATVLTGVKHLVDVPYLRHGEEPLARITPIERKYVDVPDVFELAQNYPNPFNPTTTIQFILPADAFVTLKVYNVLGQEVATLANKELYTEGMNEVEFDASNLASGVYFYQITAEVVGETAQKFSQVKKMVLMK